MKIISSATTRTVAVTPYGTDLTQFYADHGIDPAGVTVEFEPHELRDVIRSDIYKAANLDLPSLVGITADAVAICMHYTAALSKALETAVDVSDVRTAMAGFAPAMTAFQDQIDAGTIKLPYLAKGGLGVVMPEIEAAGTAVAEVFESQT